MAGQKIAGGSVVVTANADQMVAGLNKAKQKVENFGKEARAALQKVGEKLTGREGGPLAAAFGGGFAGGLMGGVAMGALEGVKDVIVSLTSNSERWKQELAGAKFHAMELEKVFQRFQKERDEFTATTTPADQERRLRFDISQAMRKREEALGTVNTMRDSLVGLAEDPIQRWQLYIRSKLDSTEAQYREALSSAESEATKMGDRLAAKKQELERLLNPSSDPAVANAYLKFRSQADEMVKTLNFEARAAGKTAMEVKLLEAAHKGIAGMDLERVREALFVTKDANLRAGIGEFTKGLQLQHATLGMTAESLDLYRFALEGANRQMLMGAAVQSELLKTAVDAQKKLEPKFAGALMAGSTEAYSFELKHKFSSKAGGDPNKGVTLWDLNVAMLKAVKELEKIGRAAGVKGAF